MIKQQSIIQDKIDKYILRLERNLRQLPKEETKDIVNEIRSHIFDSISDSNSNQDEKLEVVLAKLGKPEYYAKMLVTEHIGQVVNKGNFKQNIKSFLSEMKWPFIITTVLLTGLMLSNTLFLYGELIAKSQTSVIDALKITFYSTPAIIAIIIPMAVLYAVPSAFYTIVKSSENYKALKSFKLWSMILVTGIISTLATFAINNIIVPYSNHQSVLVAKDIITKTSNDKQQISFSDQKSIQEMTIPEAEKYLKNIKSQNLNSKEINKLEFDYYNKFSIPLICFSFTLFGAFIGCLMLSELFNKKYLMITCGWLLPTFSWFSSFSLLANDASSPALLKAFLPNILVITFSFLMLAGVFLNKDTKTNNA